MIDDLVLSVTAPGGSAQRIGGWTSVAVTRGIDRMCGSFDIALTEYYPDDPSYFQVPPGSSCEVYLGDDKVLTGYIDANQFSIASRQHDVRMVGRGKCQDLIDCSAEWNTSQYRETTLLDMAQKLAEPYGIKVYSETNSDHVFPQFNIMIGETPYDLIERVSRYLGVLVYEDADGKLVISDVGTEVADGGAIQGKNVQSASLTLSMHQRYSEYDVYLNSFDSLKDLAPGSNRQAQAKDDGVKRNRKLYVISEQGNNIGDFPQRRAYWERARRIGRSCVLRVTVDSWRDAGGDLWEPNTLLRADIPAIKASNLTWIIGEVTYRRDGGAGTTASLTLMPREAFLPQPTNLLPPLNDFVNPRS